MSATALLSEREQSALVLVSRFRFLTSWHLQSLMFADADLTPMSQAVIARKTLRMLVDRGLVQRLPRPLGGSGGGSSPHAFCLADRGARLLAQDGPRLPKRAVPRGTFLLRHALATADFAIALQVAATASADHRLLDWSCDWETAEKLGGSELIPDAFFVYQGDGVELLAFVEIDLGTVNSKYFAAKVGRYLDFFTSETWQGRLPVWPTILTVTPDAARARLLKRATESALKHRGGGLMDATEFAFAVQLDACSNPLGSVWSTAGFSGSRRLLEDGDSSE